MWVLLFTILMITISVMLLCSNKKGEHFSSSTPIYFADCSDFKQTVDTSPFFVRMSPVDLYARRASSQREYKKKYMDAFEEFTPQEKDRLVRLTSRITFAPNIPWKFAKVSASIENGFPHTLEDLIVLSTRSLSFDDQSLTETLIHEKVHVFQRKETTYVKKIIRQWGFFPVSPHVTHPLHRNNPDLPAENYTLFPETVIMQLYHSSQPASIADSTPYIISLRTGEIQPFHNPGIVPSYVSQLEHPYEIMATIMAHEYMSQNFQTPPHLLPWR
jgi:hypothetical protein